MQYVSNKFRAYSMDMWGFGDSAKNGKYSIKEQTELLVQFLDKLGIFKIAVVGHGLGALLAIELAKIMPEIVDRILAVSIPFESEMITPLLINNRASDYMDVLVSKGSSFKEEFNKFGLWTYFTNSRAVPGKYFEEASGIFGVNIEGYSTGSGAADIDNDG
ncbi:MAG: hypothetical protein CVU46_17385, partial [Chloroflexi bacterium HGW-Chloroflexi-8]